LLAPTTFDPCLWRFDGHVGSSQSLALLSLENRAKVGPMGHNKGRDNANKRAKRRKKHERLASAKRDATARQGKKAGK
jgi:hypothetical protein